MAKFKTKKKAEGIFLQIKDNGALPSHFVLDCFWMFSNTNRHTLYGWPSTVVLQNEFIPFPNLNRFKIVEFAGWHCNRSVGETKKRQSQQRNEMNFLYDRLRVWEGLLLFFFCFLLDFSFPSFFLSVSIAVAFFRSLVKMESNLDKMGTDIMSVDIILVMCSKSTFETGLAKHFWTVALFNEWRLSMAYYFKIWRCFFLLNLIGLYKLNET